MLLRLFQFLQRLGEINTTGMMDEERQHQQIHIRASGSRALYEEGGINGKKGGASERVAGCRGVEPVKWINSEKMEAEGGAVISAFYISKAYIPILLLWMGDKALKRKPSVCVVSSIIIALEIQEKVNEIEIYKPFLASEMDVFSEC